MPRWSTTGAASVLRDLLIPAGGLYGILFDRPLDPLVAGAYLVMMGLPAAGLADRLRERRNTDGPARTPPSSDPPVRTP
jgi:hypothetical protein